MRQKLLITLLASLVTGSTLAASDPYRKFMPEEYRQKNHGELTPTYRSMDLDTLYQLEAVQSGDKAEALSDAQRQHIVGRGFYSYDNIPAFQSALDTRSYQVYISRASSELNYSLSFDTRAIESEIGYGASVSVPVEGVNLKAENNFLNQFESNSKTVSLVYSFKYKYLYQITQKDSGPVMMEPTALGLYQEDPASFVSAYGNRFIDQSNVGGAVFVMIKVHFTSVKDKAAFETRVGAEVPDIASLSGYIKGSMSYDSKNGRVQIHALQIGGKPLELGKLIGNTDGGEYDFASLQTLDAKLKAVSEYPERFATQINPDDASTYVVLGTPSTMSYTTLGNIPQGSYLPEKPFSEEADDAREELSKGYEDFLTLKDHGVAVARQIDDRASQLFYQSDKQKLEKLLSYYDAVTRFYKEADNTPQQYCYLPGEEEMNCVVAAQRLKGLMSESGFETAAELQQIAADFGFSINIDDTLFAYPVSSRSTVGKLNTRIKRLEKLQASNDAGAQRFGLFNADGSYVGKATLIANAGDLETIRNSLPSAWSMNYLAQERFDQLSYNNGHVGFSWWSDSDRDNLEAMPLHVEDSAKGLFSGIQRLDNTSFQGVNYGNTSYKFGGKRKAAKLITDLFRARQIFRFDTADVLSNGIPESRYCFNNRHSTAWLKNERTGIDDGGPVHANVCVDARPGDVITWRVYWLFWDYAITRQWTVSSPGNPHTHKVLYTTAGAGAIPAGKELPRNIGEDVIIVDP